MFTKFLGKKKLWEKCFYNNLHWSKINIISMLYNWRNDVVYSRKCMFKNIRIKAEGINIFLYRLLKILNAQTYTKAINKI